MRLGIIHYIGKLLSKTYRIRLLPDIASYSHSTCSAGLDHLGKFFQVVFGKVIGS